MGGCRRSRKNRMNRRGSQPAFRHTRCSFAPDIAPFQNYQLAALENVSNVPKLISFLVALISASLELVASFSLIIQCRAQKFLPPPTVQQKQRAKGGS